MQISCKLGAMATRNPKVREPNIEIHLSHFTLLKNYLYRNSTSINSDHNHNMSKAARYEPISLCRCPTLVQATLPLHHRAQLHTSSFFSPMANSTLIIAAQTGLTMFPIPTPTPTPSLNLSQLSIKMAPRPQFPTASTTPAAKLK